MLTDRCCTYELAIPVECAKLCNYVCLKCEGTQKVRISVYFQTKCALDETLNPSTQTDMDRSVIMTTPKKSCFTECIAFRLM